MRNLVAAIALATLVACAGAYSDGSTPINGPDSGGAGSPGNPDGGDGGSDSGVDGGADAGCVAVALNGLGVIDNCLGAQTASASLSITDPAHGCAVTITLDNGDGPCTGVASGGTSNAFDGGCVGRSYPCTAPSLPGLLLCKQGLNTCTIEICDAGTCP